MAVLKNDPDEKPEIIAGKNQTVVNLATATDGTGDAIEVPGNPEILFPIRSLLPNLDFHNWALRRKVGPSLAPQ